MLGLKTCATTAWLEFVLNCLGKVFSFCVQAQKLGLKTVNAAFLVYLAITEVWLYISFLGGLVQPFPLKMHPHLSVFYVTVGDTPAANV